MSHPWKVWSPEKTALLRKLWADGLSASQCAARIGGVTRNAVIGKVHRLGLAGRATTHSARPSGQRHWTKSHPWKGSQKRKLEAMERKDIPLLPQSSTVNLAPPVQRSIAGAVLKMQEPMFGRITVENVQPHHCRWIEDSVSNPNWSFCGAPKAEGSSYCGHHSSIVYTGAPGRVRVSKQALGEVVERKDAA